MTIRLRPAARGRARPTLDGRSPVRGNPRRRGGRRHDRDRHRIRIPGARTGIASPRRPPARRRDRPGPRPLRARRVARRG
ncbi:hypothetical protein DZF93_16650, partial [Clavibacter michiganensis subsp. insidiosus]